METQLLDRTQTQERLGGISRPTLDRLRQSGQLPAVLIGRRVFFHVDDIDAYIARQRPSTAAAPSKELDHATYRLLRKFHSETECGKAHGHWAECNRLVDAAGWDTWEAWDTAGKEGLYHFPDSKEFGHWPPVQLPPEAQKRTYRTERITADGMDAK